MMARRTAACVFCEIVAGRASASFVHEDESVVAFMDIRPVNPGHLLVVSRQHLESLSELGEELGSRLFNVARDLQSAIRASGIRCEGINLFVAEGEVAGQEVFHAHLHVVPRFAGDSFRVTADWPSLRPREELEAVAAKVRNVAVVAGASDDGGGGRAPVTGLGLADDEVRIEPYDYSWPEHFAEICSLIRPAAPDARIEHVGSTSIPGCSAKPLIDVSVVLSPGTSLDTEAASACGLVFRAVNPEATLFVIYGPLGRRLANVHVRYRGSSSELWDLLFRDFMREHPKDMVAYGEMKCQAVVAGDRAAYSRAKAPFIESVSPRIHKWASESGWAPPVVD